MQPLALTSIQVKGTIPLCTLCLLLSLGHQLLLTILQLRRGNYQSQGLERAEKATSWSSSLGFDIAEELAWKLYAFQGIFNRDCGAPFFPPLSKPEKTPSTFVWILPARGKPVSPWYVSLSLQRSLYGSSVRRSANSFTVLHCLLCEWQLVRMIKNQFLCFKLPNTCEAAWFVDKIHWFYPGHSHAITTSRVKALTEVFEEFGPKTLIY